MNESFQITIAQICLANAVRDEAQPEYRYGKREKHYLELISQRQADVYSIKEIRPCQNEDGTEILSSLDIVNRLAAPRNLALAALIPNSLQVFPGRPYNPFYLAQLYNPNKLVVQSTEMKVLSPTMYYLRVRYMPKGENGVPIEAQAFTVDSVQFPTANADKTAIAASFSNDAHLCPRTLRVGDFNLFKDDPDHNEHLRLLGEGFQNAGSINMVNERLESMYGTFQPFPHDKPPVEVSPPWEDSPHTKFLDYVWVSNDFSEPKECLTVLVENDRSQLPWDHLPLFFTMTMH